MNMNLFLLKNNKTNSIYFTKYTVCWPLQAISNGLLYPIALLFPALFAHCYLLLSVVIDTIPLSFRRKQPVNY